jgi:hypothetical protein
MTSPFFIRLVVWKDEFIQYIAELGLGFVAALGILSSSFKCFENVIKTLPERTEI